MTSNAVTASAERIPAHYLNEISKFPMLSFEEEQALAAAGAMSRTSKRRTSLSPHIFDFTKIAMGYRGYGLPVAELIAEGNIGMMQAVKRFDPDPVPPRHLRHMVDQGRNPGIHPP